MLFRNYYIKNVIHNFEVHTSSSCFMWQANAHFKYKPNIVLHARQIRKPVWTKQRKLFPVSRFILILLAHYLHTFHTLKQHGHTVYVTLILNLMIWDIMPSSCSDSCQVYPQPRVTCLATNKHLTQISSIQIFNIQIPSIQTQVMPGSSLKVKSCIEQKKSCESHAK